MDIQFRGGPLDGQRHHVDREPETDQVVYWVADDARFLDESDVPGVQGVVEYIYRGSGSADYVGGLPGGQDGEAVRSD